jgi:ferredoxin-like protein FixX
VKFKSTIRTQALKSVISSTSNKASAEPTIKITPAAQGSQKEVGHYQHKIKCLECGLHFVVCSDYKDWPCEGTTVQLRDFDTPEATEQSTNGHAFCPECGKRGQQMVWRSEESNYIFEVVPGQAEVVGLKKSAETRVAKGVA